MANAAVTTAMQPAMNPYRALMVVAVVLLSATATTNILYAQRPVALSSQSENRPLKSLNAAAQAELKAPHPPRDFPFVVPNRIPKEDLRTKMSDLDAPDPLAQETVGAAATSVATGFDGTSNDDNAAILGFRVAPPDTDGDVGRSYVVQVINLLMTVFDKNGTIVSGPFPANAIWSGAGGLCEAYNRGDPVVLYDETNDRWVVSQFAFDDAFLSFSECVAISTSGDPTGAYNRYEFSFSDTGFPDYPKLGIVSESITMMANIFIPLGGFGFFYYGPLLAVMDKAAMYAGQDAWIVGSLLGSNEFGFVAGDLDDPSASAGFVPGLFATAMTNAGKLDIWEVDPNWANHTQSTSHIASLNISPYDPDLCGASREACIPQPGTSQALEAITDRLMHRLQIRDFGSYLSMVTAHTVDVGGGRAGIRWYELRKGAGSWAVYQQGTYAPNDGRHRWMPSVAMNAAGDIGLGYLVSDGSTTYMSTAVSGQTAANSGSGQLDAAEMFCANGAGAQTGTARAGDYSATSVDPLTDNFWHTNEYGPTTGSFEWATAVCEFSVSGGTSPPPTAPAAPSDLVATAVSTSEIDVTWTNNATDADYVEVESSPDGTTFSVIASVSPTTSSYPDIGLAASTTRHYRVRAFNGVGPSSYSNTDFATTFSDAGPTSVHIENIATSTQNSRGNKTGVAEVTIFDDTGQPVSGADVSGTFGGSFSESGSGTTGADGVAEITTSSTQRGGVSVEFCVNSVAASLPYDPADNVSPSYDCSSMGKRAFASAETPDGYALAQNFPNPFNPVTAIDFDLPEASHVVLKVYNMVGMEVATLVDGYEEGGRHSVRFDASGLSTGLYIYTIKAGPYTASRKMSLLK